MWPYFISCTLAVVRTCTCYVRASTTTRAHLYYNTCAPLHRPTCAIHVRDQNDNATYASTRWVPTVRHFLACEDVGGGSQQSGGESFFARNMDTLPCLRRCSWWVLAVRGKRFFRKIQWPVRWVPAIRWRNHYFPRNKEALCSCGRGPSYSPLHVQYSSDGSRSLTTPRGEHHGGGRRRGLGRGRRGAGEDAAVDAHAEGSTWVDYFGCGMRLPSPKNNRRCG